MPWIEQARLLLRKAEQDATAVRHLVGDPDVADEIVGFHTQQACEKALKAVLSRKGVAFPFTHNLVQLLDLVGDAGVDVPPAIAEVAEWTPFAAFFRYAEWSAPEPMDRERAVSAVDSAITWAEPIVMADDVADSAAMT
jgi:HEPN domain-containing protein